MAVFLYDNDLELITTFKGDEIITNTINQELNSLDQMTVEVDLSKSNFELASANNIKGGYLATSFRGRDVIYRIFTSTVNSDENTIEFIANNLGYDDFGGFYKSYTYENKQLSDILSNLLTGTGWSFEISGVKNRTKVSSEEFDNEKLIDIIQTLATFYKCDFKFEVVISEGIITSKRLIMSTRLGKDDKQNRFVYDVDMTSIEMVEDYKDMISKGIGRGKKLQDENGKDLGYINFSNLTLNSTPEIPLHTSRNQDYLISDVAYAIKKLSNGGHRTKIYDFDTESPQELLELTIDSMLEDSRPKTTFKMSTAYINVEKLLNVGDTVYIVRNDINLYYTSRITSITYDLLDKYNDVCEVGDVIYKSKAKRIKELEQKTKTKVNRGTTTTKGRPYPMAEATWFTYNIIDWAQVDENGQNTTKKVAMISGFTTYGINQITGGEIKDWEGFEFPSSAEVNGVNYDIKGIDSLNGNTEINNILNSKVMYIPVAFKRIKSLNTSRLMLFFENSSLPDNPTNDDKIDLNDSGFMYSLGGFNTIKVINFPDHAVGRINIAQNNFGAVYNPKGMTKSLSMTNTRARGESESNLDDYYYYSSVTSEENAIEINSLGNYALIDLYKNGYNLVIPSTFESENLSGEKQTYNIKRLGNSAFITVTELKSIECGAVEYIEAYACANLSNLTAFASSVPIKTINSNAFQNCSSLSNFGRKGSYSASDFVTVATIGSRAFSNCSQLSINPSNYASDDFNVILGNYKNESLNNVLTTIQDRAFENVPSQSINNLLKIAYRLATIGAYAFTGSQAIIDLSNCVSYSNVIANTFSGGFISTLKLPKLALKKYFSNNAVVSISPVLTINQDGINLSGITNLNLEDVTNVKNRGIRSQIAVIPINATNYPKEFIYNFESLEGVFTTNGVVIELSKDTNISIGNLNNCVVDLTLIAPDDSNVSFTNLYTGSAILSSPLKIVNGQNMSFSGTTSVLRGSTFSGLNFNGHGILLSGSKPGIKLVAGLFYNTTNNGFDVNGALLQGNTTIPNMCFRKSKINSVQLGSATELALIDEIAFLDCTQLNNSNSSLISPNGITIRVGAFRNTGFLGGTTLRVGSSVVAGAFDFDNQYIEYI